MSNFEGISLKNVKLSKSKAGRDVTTYYFSPEEVGKLIEKLTAVQGNERGVKISIHSQEEDAPWGGTKINAFGFVNAVEAPGANRGAAGGGQAKGKFVPKAKGMSADTRAKAAATLNTEVE